MLTYTTHQHPPPNRSPFPSTTLFILLTSSHQIMKQASSCTLTYIKHVDYQTSSIVRKSQKRPISKRKTETQRTWYDSIIIINTSHRQNHQKHSKLTLTQNIPLSQYKHLSSLPRYLTYPPSSAGTPPPKQSTYIPVPNHQRSTISLPTPTPTPTNPSIEHSMLHKDPPPTLPLYSPLLHQFPLLNTPYHSPTTPPSHSPPSTSLPFSSLPLPSPSHQHSHYPTLYKTKPTHQGARQSPALTSPQFQKRELGYV